MKTITATPHKLAVRQGPAGYEILCTPGALATFLYRLSQDAVPLRVEWAEGQYLNVIPYTSALDIALVGLVDDLITLRYEAGRVQLELFSLEEV